MDLKPPNYKFCPFCAAELLQKVVDGKNRKYCPKDNWTYFPHVAGSCSAIVIDRGKVLMVKRNIEPHKGTWMFPSGFINYGEHPKETALRELHEETGLEAKNAELLDILQADDSREPGHFLFIYKIIGFSGELKNQEDENTEVTWVNINSQPTIGWQTHQQVFSKLNTFSPS